MTSQELADLQSSSVKAFQSDSFKHWSSSAKEIPDYCCCDLYLTEYLQLTPESRTVEVGGYLGKWTAFINNKFQCFVDVYEPVKQFYDELVIRFSGNPKIQLFNFGIEAEDGLRHIALAEDGSSLFSTSLTRANVSVRDASHIIQRNRVVDLLSLNCEGSEYGILDRLIFTSDIRKVKSIMVQFHSNFPEAEIRREHIRKSLLKTHTEVFCYPFVWEIWNLI